MSRYIVDASIAVKLYVPEAHSQQAIQFFSDQHELIAPDLMLAEFGNIIWKKVRLLRELTSDEGKKVMAAAQTLPLVYHSTVDLINDAFEIALNAQRTVYDSLYVALAASQGCQLMTDDRKLHSALQQTSLAAFLTLIENY
jgi:predicted nucleic acid-binding protein